MRMAHHRNDYSVWKNHTAKKQNKIMSYDLFDEYGVENCFIVLIENYPCNSKDEKNAREAHWIQSIECANKKYQAEQRGSIMMTTLNILERRAKNTLIRHILRRTTKTNLKLFNVNVVSVIRDATQQGI